MTDTSQHSQVCLDAFINCESLLTGLQKTKSNFPLVKLLEECAHICMGTFHAIKNDSVNTFKLAVLCIGICDECAEVCDSFKDFTFKQCAQACRYCSNCISDLAITGFDYN